MNFDFCQLAAEVALQGAKYRTKGLLKNNLSNYALSFCTEIGY